MPWLAILANRWFQLVCVIAAAGLAIAVQQYRVNACKAHSAKLEAQNTVLGRQLADQNAAIKDWQDRAAKAKKEAKDALDRVRKGRVATQAEIARLEALAASSGSAQKGCKDAWAAIRSGS